MREQSLRITAVNNSCLKIPVPSKTTFVIRTAQKHTVKVSEYAGDVSADF